MYVFPSFAQTCASLVHVAWKYRHIQERGIQGVVLTALGHSNVVWSVVDEAVVVQVRILICILEISSARS